MGKQCGPYFITGTYSNICFYKMEGKYYVRMKSSLSGKRVKKDKRFARTMQYAELLGKASKIASQVYRTYNKETRQFSQYRELTGKAMQLLKDGFTEAAALALLLPRRREVKKAKVKRAPTKSLKLKAASYVLLQRHEGTKKAPIETVDYAGVGESILAESG